ncbi:hypothetical protein C8Q77DRAFT_1237425 [Trametes polyzona]|nr:hypothetical protein C8Q77DRAFT_1237425 [Trametes polyzona]
MGGMDEIVDPTAAYYWSDDDDWTDEVHTAPERTIVGVHRVLFRTAFRPEASDWYYALLDDAQLRQLTSAGLAYTGDVCLRAHPLIQWSFATDIPVESLEIGKLATFTFPTRVIDGQSGVTVLGVMTASYCDLNTCLPFDELSDFIETEGKYIFGDKYTTLDMRRRFRPLRVSLTECRISEFYNDQPIQTGPPKFHPSLNDMELFMVRNRRPHVNLDVTRPAMAHMFSS